MKNAKWTYGVVGSGDIGYEAMRRFRKKGVAICYRMNSDTCQIWRYKQGKWEDMPGNSMPFTALCSFAG